MIERALQRHRGNRRKTAEALKDQHGNALAQDEAVRTRSVISALPRTAGRIEQPASSSTSESQQLPLA